MLLENKIVALTGAASGIGRQTALRAVTEGATVIAVDRDEAGLATLAHETGAALIAVEGDVTDVAFARTTLNRAVQRFGRLDGTG